MKRSLKRMMLLLAVVLTVMMPLYSVNAETVEKDGVSVTVSTDKDSYAPGETVKVNLLLKNDSGADLQNVTMENLTPAGCVIVPGSSAVKELPTLANNGQVTLASSFQVEKEIVPPKTGDDTPILLWVSLALLSGCLLFAFKRIGTKRTITMLLILVLNAFLLPVELAQADTAQINPQQLTVKKNVAIKGVPTELRSQVTFGAAVWASDDKDALFYKEPDPEHFQYDEARKIYYVDNQILLIAKEGTPQAQVKALVESYGGTIVGMIAITDDYQAEFKQAMTYAELEDLCNKLRTNSFIEHANLHTFHEIEFNSTNPPNDIMWKKESWEMSIPDGLNWNIEAIKAPAAWSIYDNYKSEEKINIGIIDNCFDKSHEDLTFTNTWYNNDLPKNNENYYIQENYYKVQGDDESRYNKVSAYYWGLAHGTHVSGTMAADFNNKKGISGIVPDVNLYGFSINGFSSHPDSDASYDRIGMMSIFKWKYSLVTLVIQNCRVINISMGRPYDNYIEDCEIYGEKKTEEMYRETYDLLDDFITKLVNHHYDFLIVESAGNDGVDAYKTGLFTGCENNRERVIVVGSVGSNGTHFDKTIGKEVFDGYRFSKKPDTYWSSNYGNYVDIVAPGELIYSTVPYYHYENKHKIEYHNYYDNINKTIIEKKDDTWDGTSMAAPHVSGVAAMCYRINPGLTAVDVKNILLETTSQIIRCEFDGKQYSYGLLDAEAAVEKTCQKSFSTPLYSTKGMIRGTAEATVYDDEGVLTKTNQGIIVLAHRIDTLNDDTLVQSTMVNLYKTSEFEIIVEPGDYYITIYREGCIPCILRTKVEANRITNVDPIELSPISSSDSNGTMKGRIIDNSTGNGIPYVDMYFYPSWSPSTELPSSWNNNEIPKTSTDSNGNYSISIPEGAYTAHLYKNGYTDSYFYVTSSNYYSRIGYIDTANIDQNGTMTSITMPTISLGGKVKSNNGIPLKGVTITLSTDINGLEAYNLYTTPVTDGTGQWSVVDLPKDKDYYAWFKLDGYSFDRNPVKNPKEGDAPVIGMPIQQEPEASPIPTSLISGELTQKNYTVTTAENDAAKIEGTVQAAEGTSIGVISVSILNGANQALTKNYQDAERNLPLAQRTTKVNLADIFSVIPSQNSNFATPGNYTIRVYAKAFGSDDAVLIGEATVTVNEAPAPSSEPSASPMPEASPVPTSLISGKLTQTKYTVTTAENDAAKIEGTVQAAEGTSIGVISVSILNGANQALTKNYQDAERNLPLAQRTTKVNLADIFSVIPSQNANFATPGDYTIRIYAKAFDADDAVLIGEATLTVNEAPAQEKQPALTPATISANGNALIASTTQDYNLDNGDLTLSWSGDTGSNGNYLVTVGLIDAEPLFGGTEEASSQLSQDTALVLNGTKLYNWDTIGKSVTIPAPTLQAGKYLKIAVAVKNEKGDTAWTVTSLKLVADQQPEPESSPASDFYFADLTDATCKITKYNGSDEKVVIPSTDPDGKTVIAIECAFYNNTSVKSITIPNTVTTINYNAFYGCTNLSSVTIPNSVTTIGEKAFYGCSNLTGLTIPTSVTSIDGYAFYGCSSLTSITIPNDVTSISSWVFANCTNLKSITLPNNVASLGEYAFYGCRSLESITIPESVTSIDYMAFYGCSSLTELSIPNKVTSIGRSAFSGCSGLKSIRIPESVNYIDASTFSGCTNLASIYIPQDVTLYDDGGKNLIFSGCRNLTIYGYTGSKAEEYANKHYIPFVALDEHQTTATITGAMTKTSYEVSQTGQVSLEGYVDAQNGSIGRISVSVWKGDDRALTVSYDENEKTHVDLSDIFTIIPSENSNFSEAKEYSIAVYAKAYGSEDAVKIGEATVTVADESGTDILHDFEFTTLTATTCEVAKYIGDNTFVNIPTYDSEGRIVTGIGDLAFGYGAPFGVPNTQEVILPDTITRIGKSAFVNCHLKKIVIPESVKVIDDFAFARCEEMTTVQIDGSASIGAHAFDSCGNLSNIACGKVISIGDNAFSECSKLETILLSDGIKSIGNNAFENCSSLSSVSLPDSITSIGVEAFKGCSSIEKIIIPGGIENIISPDTFLYCNALKSVYFKEGNRYICSIEECDNLEEIHVPDSAEYMYFRWGSCPIDSNQCWEIMTEWHKGLKVYGSADSPIKEYEKLYDFTFIVEQTSDTSQIPLIAPTIYANRKLLTAATNQTYGIGNSDLTISWDSDTGSNGTYFVTIGHIDEEPIFGDIEEASIQVSQHDALLINGIQLYRWSTTDQSITIPESMLQPNRNLKIAVASRNNNDEEKWTVTCLKLVNTQSSNVTLTVKNQTDGTIINNGDIIKFPVNHSFIAELSAANGNDKFRVNAYTMSQKPTGDDTDRNYKVKVSGTDDEGFWYNNAEFTADYLKQFGNNNTPAVPFQANAGEAGQYVKIWIAAEDENYAQNEGLAQMWFALDLTNNSSTPVAVKTSEKGIAFIKNFESCKLYVYDDGAGNNTIGWGHKLVEGDGFTENSVITQEEADALFLRDLAAHEERTDEFIKNTGIQATQQIYDALSSFFYNGNGGAQSNSSSFYQMFANNKSDLSKIDPKDVYRMFAQFCNPTDPVVRGGLFRRRCNEARIMLDGVYELKNWTIPDWVKDGKHFSETDMSWYPVELDTLYPNLNNQTIGVVKFVDSQGKSITPGTVLSAYLSDGSLKAQWSCDNASSYFVKAIIVADYPSGNAQDVVKELKNDIHNSSSITFTADTLKTYAEKGQYLKIAVQGIDANGNKSEFKWIGYTLVPQAAVIGTPSVTPEQGGDENTEFEVKVTTPVNMYGISIGYYDDNCLNDTGSFKLAGDVYTEGTAGVTINKTGTNWVWSIKRNFSHLGADTNKTRHTHVVVFDNPTKTGNVSSGAAAKTSNFEVKKTEKKPEVRIVSVSPSALTNDGTMKFTITFEAAYATDVSFNFGGLDVMEAWRKEHPDDFEPDYKTNWPLAGTEFVGWTETEKKEYSISFYPKANSTLNEYTITMTASGKGGTSLEAKSSITLRELTLKEQYGVDFTLNNLNVSVGKNRDYMNEEIRKRIIEKKEFDNVLKIGKNEPGGVVVFMFEGCGKSSDTTGANRRRNATCVVIRKVSGNPTIVFELDDCSTLPSEPWYSTEDNNSLAGYAGTGMSTIIDNTYNIETVYHNGNFLALSVYNTEFGSGSNMADTIRFKSTETKDNAGTVIRQSEGNSGIKSMGGGIHVHMKWTDTGYNYYSSGEFKCFDTTGCITISQGYTSTNYLNFMKAVGAVKPNETSIISKTFTQYPGGHMEDYSQNEYIGQIVIDRTKAAQPEPNESESYLKKIYKTDEAVKLIMGNNYPYPGE